MTVKQLTTVFFKSQSTAYKPLQRLRAAGLLADEPTPYTGEMLLYVTDRGAGLLREHLDYPDEAITRPLKIIRNPNSAQTLHSVNAFRTRVLRAHRDSDKFHLLEWMDENRFRSQPDYVTVRNKRKPLYPDGLMHLELPDFYSYCYVEIDSGTERLDDVKRQLEVYDAYTDAGLHQKRFQSDGFRVLIISTTQRRLQGIIDKAHEVGIWSHFWFTTLDEIEPETFFTAPIWRRFKSEQETRMSLADVD